MPEVLRNLLSGIASLGILFTPRQYDDLNTVFNSDDLENIRNDVNHVAQEMEKAIAQVELEQSTAKS